MPLLYKSKFFGARTRPLMKAWGDERLSFVSYWKPFSKVLIGLFPHQFCNIYVLDAQKK